MYCNNINSYSGVRTDISLQGKKKQADSNIYEICITFKEDMYIAKAYYDTGNMLRDMSGRPVLICNSILAMKLLGTAYKDIIDSYTAGNCFNYKCANLISSIYFQPIPYRTVSTGFS
ncbi:MAG: sigma-E processing peptidase SpoIIGA, partial [Lachnospiraceae bacterium]|nr:sigma-E processing peptidase SpoIIGA [Lachnospiraceae bacterium]